MRSGTGHPFLRTTALVVSAVIALSGCQGQATQSPASSGGEPSQAASAGPSPTEPLILKADYSFTPVTWDPNKSVAVEYYYLVNMYEQLVFAQPDNSLAPGLATSWDTSADGLTWTFHLREGVKFHDGESLTADAVKRSIERTIELGPAGFIWQAIESIDTPDDLTVVMNLSTPAQMDLAASAGWGAWITSPKALDAAAENPDYFETGLAAGTGPYTLESYTPDAEAVFQRFDDYWGGWEGVHYSTVVASITPEATIQMQKLQSGESDLAQSLPTDSLATFENNPDYTVLGPYPSWNTSTAFFLTIRPPTDNKLVRQALSYAVPYDDILEVGFNGNATQPHTSIPENVFPYDPSVPQYSLDLEKAADLLSQAGYADGLDLEMAFTQQSGAYGRFTPLIKESFAKIGVNLTLVPMLFAQQRERVQGPVEDRADIHLQGYAPVFSDAGADNLHLQWGCPDQSGILNWSSWCNQDYQDLIDAAAAAAATDRAEGQRLYTEAMNLLVEEAPGIFLSNPQTRIIMPSRITGFTFNVNNPEAAWIWYDLQPAS
jgi:peptide/nickel transport system substrate-binding protein